jgi:predicted lipid-binding transport protein (Tim44 family)
MIAADVSNILECLTKANGGTVPRAIAGLHRKIIASVMPDMYAEGSRSQSLFENGLQSLLEDGQSTCSVRVPDFLRALTTTDEPVGKQWCSAAANLFSNLVIMARDLCFDSLPVRKMANSHLRLLAPYFMEFTDIAEDRRTVNCTECIGYLAKLNLSTNSTLEEIQQRYRDLCNVWHPDRFEHNERLKNQATREFQDIQEAYGHLKDHFKASPSPSPSVSEPIARKRAATKPVVSESNAADSGRAQWEQFVEEDNRVGSRKPGEAGTSWAGRDLNATQERGPVVIIFFVLLAIAASVIYIVTRQPNHAMPVSEPSQGQALGSPESAPQAGSGEPGDQTPSANAEATNPSSVGDIEGSVQVADASGDFDPLLALEVLFGPVNREAQTATWLQPSKPPQGFPGLSFNTATDRLAVRVVSTLRATEGGAAKRYLITAAYPADKDYKCHACSAIIGAAEFRQNDAHWELEAFSPYVCRGPGFAVDPDATLVKIGPDRYGVSLASRNGSQGQEWEYVQIVATIGNWIGEVLEQSTSYAGENANARNYSWSNRTSIQPVPGFNPEYFDIQIITTGTTPSADYSSAISADKSRLLTLIDHSYR